MADHFTTREVAEFVGTEEWRVRRLYEDGNLPEPPRFAGKQAISSATVPLIVDPLRARGWMPAMEAAK